MSVQCPLPGVKQTSRRKAATSGFDPKRTFGGLRSDRVQPLSKHSFEPIALLARDAVAALMVEHHCDDSKEYGPSASDCAEAVGIYLNDQSGRERPVRTPPLHKAEVEVGLGYAHDKDYLTAC